MKVLPRRQIVAANIYYTVPGDKELQILDFYAAELLYSLLKQGPPPSREFARIDDSSSLYASGMEAVTSIVGTLRQTLLNGIYQAISGELRHIDSLQMLDDKHASGMARYLDGFGHAVDHTSEQERWDAIKNSGFDPHKEKAPAAYYYREHNAAIFYASKQNPTEFVNMALHSFEEGDWESGYGGSAWADICNGWLRLNSAKGIEQTFVAIDHCLDLEHNTGTFMDKLPGFAKIGVRGPDFPSYGWIKWVLNFKRDAAPPALLSKCSSQMRNICLRVFKAYNPTFLG